WYRGKPIFYGLGNFLFDIDFEMSPATFLTMLGWVAVEGGAIVDAGFVPCRASAWGAVAPVGPDSDEGREIVEYMERCNTAERRNGAVTADDAPVVGGCASVRLVPTYDPRARR